MSSPDDQNLGENDDLKKVVVEDFQKKLELSDDTEVDLVDDEETTEGSDKSSSSQDKVDEGDEVQIAKSDEADKEKENPISNVEEITEEEGGATLNISEDNSEKKIDSGDQRDDDVLVAKSDETDKEKEIPISTVQEITEEGEEGGATLNISEDNGEKNIDSEDQRDDDVLVAKCDEADKEKEIPISTVQEITEEGSSVLSISEETGKKKINGSEDQQVEVVLISKPDEEKEIPIPAAQVTEEERSSSSLNISGDNGEKNINDSEDQQDRVLNSRPDEAGEEKENSISTVEEITEEESTSSSLNISEEDGKKKYVDQQDDDRLISKSDEADEGGKTPNKLKAIGTKIATAGRFVDGGDSVLLAHDDGSCSLYDAANFEEKLEFKNISPEPNLLRDCWMVRAHGPNQESKKYIVATSSGNRRDSGFYSWDFESRQIESGYHISHLSLQSYSLDPMSPISAQWYSPSDHLVATALTLLKTLTIYDIRDFSNKENWDLVHPVCPLQHTSPLQWRDRGKIVIAHPTQVAFWDTNGYAYPTCEFDDEQIHALHVSDLNPDAETGGIRQRASPASSEAPDGVVCTSRSISVLDTRKKDGKGMRIRTEGMRPHSVYCDSRSIYMGCDDLASASNSSYIQCFSLSGARLVCSYEVRPPTKRPDNDVRSVAVRQVWGDSRYVMGMCKSGLHVFNSSEDATGGTRLAREVVGCGDEAVVRCPSFDFSGSRVLLVNGHGPAQWKSLD